MHTIIVYPLSRGERIIVKAATVVTIILAVVGVGSMLAVSIAAGG